MDSLEPRAVVDPMIAAFLPGHLRNGRQQDSQEALGALLDDIMDDDFVLKTNSCYECIYGNSPTKKREKYEPMTILQLALDCTPKQVSSSLDTSKFLLPRAPQQSPPPCQMQTLIENFFTVEEIKPSDVEIKKGMISIKKHYKILKYHKILIVQLKRFVFLQESLTSQKNLNPVVGSDSIVLPGGVIYQLQSFVYHSGSIGGGHYTAYVKNEIGSFTYFSDKFVSEAVDPSGLLDTGYLYFYERVDEQICKTTK
jgi:ubiquitin C-terminal hydrolase